MTPTLVAAPLQAIDTEDRRFAVPFHASAEEMHRSLDRAGVVSPLWTLRRAEGKALVVDGFKRLEWLIRNGVDEVHCLAYPPDCGTRDLWLRRIEGKLHGPPLNAAEKAWLAKVLAGLLPEETVRREYFPSLGLPATPQGVERWVRLADSGTGLLEALAEEIVGERAALLLLEWEDADRDRCLSWLEELRCSASLQVEIVERIAEIARGQGLEPRDVLDDPEAVEVVRNPGWNRRRKTQWIREWLYRKRYPRLSFREEEFRLRREAARLPARVKLTPPKYFEGEEWEMRLTFRGPRELEELAQAARDFSRSPALRDMMEPPPGGDGG